MSRPDRVNCRLWLLLSITIGLLAPAALAPAAQAEVKWAVTPLASKTAPAGSTVQYVVQIRNVGTDSADATSFPLHFAATLPPGMTVAEVTPVLDEGYTGEGTSWDCSSLIPGTSEFDCTNSLTTLLPWQISTLRVTLEVGAGLPEGKILTAQFTVSGGSPTSPSTTTPDPTTVASDPFPFGIDAFDSQATANADRALFTQASGHPYALTTDIDFNTETNPDIYLGTAWPVEPPKDIRVDLPPGTLGDLSDLPQCTLQQLTYAGGEIDATPTCLPESQIGVARLRFRGSIVSGSIYVPDFLTEGAGVAVFNMVPPPGVAARIGFDIVGVVIVIDARVRNDTDYGVSIDVPNISQGLGFAGTNLTIWGAPASPVHDRERGCPGEQFPGFVGAPSCIAEGTPAILRQPSSCTAPGEGLATHLSVDSWVNPGDFTAPFHQATAISHDLPGYPWPEEEDGVRKWGQPRGTDECGDVPFGPTISVQPTIVAADSPTGLDFHLSVPQHCWKQPGAICQSDLKDAAVKLPAGMSLNPSAAAGLGACTTAQVGYKPGTSGPFEFDEAPASCPDNAKLGTVEITTPLLDHPVEGAVYFAQQSQNPFGSLLAMYLVAEDPISGLVLKQAGKIEADPTTGRLTTVFTGTPQAPFSDLHLQLFGGPRAALRTPPACGEYAVQATLTPWSGNAPARTSDVFTVDSCPNSGFDPAFHAGTTNPLAGATSPFSLRLTREDGTKEITGLQTTLPKGLVAYLKGIPYCPYATLAAISHDLGTGAAQIASPSCPAASLVGHVTAGAGAGPSPFYTTQGRAYWAGPYHGAPVSLAVVFPAVAGPFDLGNVVIRNGFEVNPETAQITAISDPIPTSLFGIPLDLRDIRVELDRPNYVLNPTSCEPMSFDAIISGAGGTSANRSERFQAGGCDRLAFKPKLALKLSGSHTRRGHPALKAVLTMPPGGANIASAQVALPPTELLDNAHIGTVCTRVQYHEGAGGGANCPPRSLIGHAAAYSPILDYYLQGPVYLRSSDNPLPDLVASLGGQIQVDVVGRVDSVKKTGALRTTFASVPDAPVSKFTLTMAGGKKGLLQNSTNLCKGTHRALALFDAQNGKTKDLQPVVKADCGGNQRKGGGNHRSHGAR